jgi:hypothetical protein
MWNWESFLVSLIENYDKVHAFFVVIYYDIWFLLSLKQKDYIVYMSLLNYGLLLVFLGL